MAKSIKIGKGAAEADSEGLKRKSLAPKEIIFEQGDEANVAYLIADGEVEIYRKSGRGEVGVASLSRGDIFGEMSLIDGKPRAASARAVSEVELIVVRPSDLKKRLAGLSEYDMVLRRLIDVFVLRLRGQLDRND
ncbi:MAG: cyclic nucleotide-binding domain-containing protein [Rhodospirillales bacterium]